VPARYQGPAPEDGPGPEEGPRHEAREHAVALLYEAEMKKSSLTDVMAALAVTPDAYTTALVTGVATDGHRIDELVSDAAVDWELERMPVVDRTILRLATWELLDRPDVPVAVILDEAVELAKQYSTEQSGGFVNGVLSTIAAQIRPDRG
jgi:transcription antitermination protein NusB